MAILHTIGALAGGIVRVTVPSLNHAQRRSIIRATDSAIQAVQRRDVAAHGAARWALVEQFAASCPNPVLICATQQAIIALAHRLTRAEFRDAIDAPATIGHTSREYRTLRAAVDVGDAVTAEQAMQRAFRLPGRTP
ncbi:FCD domain-containing protein [Plantibacter sp. YIM 135249]|uniref:FCD domain-containing protein n=1 Tax=Plantibacter sp. YIM 135249 TaxID=3423918 RepID=UPI003D3286FB